MSVATNSWRRSGVMVMHTADDQRRSTQHPQGLLLVGAALHQTALPDIGLRPDLQRHVQKQFQDARIARPRRKIGGFDPVAYRVLQSSGLCHDDLCLARGGNRRGFGLRVGVQQAPAASPGPWPAQYLHRHDPAHPVTGKREFGGGSRRVPVRRSLRPFRPTVMLATCTDRSRDRATICGRKHPRIAHHSGQKQYWFVHPTFCCPGLEGPTL